MAGVKGLGHVPQPRNFTIENKFSSEDFLANCHWQFSPAPSEKSKVRLSLSKINTDHQKTVSIYLGREFHMLLELFKYIAEKPDESRMTLEKPKATSRREKFVLDVVY